MSVLRLCAIVAVCLWSLSGIDAFSVLPTSSSSSRSRSQSLLPLHAITSIQSHYEMTDFVHSDSELSVVCFHAHWCRTCQKVQHYYHKLDASHPYGVKLANVEYSQHVSMSKSLGVTKLPTMQFYYQGKKLDEFTCGPKTFARVLGTIQCLRDEIESEQTLSHQLDQGAALMQAAMMEPTRRVEVSSSPVNTGSSIRFNA